VWLTKLFDHAKFTLLSNQLFFTYIMKRITGSFDVKKAQNFNVVMSPDAKVWYINIKCKVNKFNVDGFRAYMNFYSNNNDQDNYLTINFFQRAAGQTSIKAMFNNPFRSYMITANEPDWTVTTVATANTEGIVNIVLCIDYEKLALIAGFDDKDLLNNCVLHYGIQDDSTMLPSRSSHILNDRWRLVGFGTCTTFDEARKCNRIDMNNFRFGSTNCFSGIITELYYGDIAGYCCSNPGSCVREDYLCNRKPLIYGYQPISYMPSGISRDDWGLDEHFTNGPKEKKDITLFVLMLFLIVIIVSIFHYFSSPSNTNDEVITLS
jgi:hypothetical protein